MGAISTAYSDPILSIGNTIYFGDAPLTPEKYVMNVAMGAAMAIGFDQLGKLFSKYWHNVTGGGNVKQTPKQGFDAEGTFDPVTVESKYKKAARKFWENYKF